MTTKDSNPNTTQRGRAWTVTIWDFKPNGEWKKDFEQLYNGKTISYCVVGYEIAPTTGRPHLQGYVSFKGPQRYTRLRKLFGSTSHFELAGGGYDANRKYCSKDGDYVEYGNPPVGSGSRTDLSTVRKRLLDGERLEVVARDATSYQAIKYAENLAKYLEKERDWKPKVFWYWGPTGTGKTKSAYEEAKALGRTWISGTNAKWWDGYDGHECVILDDIRATEWPFALLLRILDRFPLRVEVKGSSRQLLAKYIWVTCPYEPENFHACEDTAQLVRRIDVTKYFGNSE